MEREEIEEGLLGCHEASIGVYSPSPPPCMEAGGEGGVVLYALSLCSSLRSYGRFALYSPSPPPCMEAGGEGGGLGLDRLCFLVDYSFFSSVLVALPLHLHAWKLVEREEE